MHKTILIVDDEEDIRLMVQGLLEDEGYSVSSVGTSQKAYEFIAQTPPDLVVQDIWLQGSEDDGVDILKSDLKQQNIQLKASVREGVHQFISQVPDVTRQLLDKVAQTNSRVFFVGEAGTGKAGAAQYVHDGSLRADFPFMSLDCTGQSAEHIEAKLFGSAGKAGLLELVNGGTLLFDEVLNLPLEVQGKVLSFLQDGAYYSEGDAKKNSIDVRVVSTTSGDPESAIESGSFREDLYYRLNVVPVEMLPLRQRRQDIPDLISRFSRGFSFTSASVSKLRSYSWPGNIKQFHNVLEWLSIMYEPEEEIGVMQLPTEISGVHEAAGGAEQGGGVAPGLFDEVMELGLRDARERFERHYLLSQVGRFAGNISKTATFIGMERSALHRKLKSLDVVFSNDKQDVA